MLGLETRGGTLMLDDADPKGMADQRCNGFVLHLATEIRPMCLFASSLQ